MRTGIVAHDARMAITSSSTLAQVRAAYEDAAHYEEDGSATQARALITAANVLILRLSSEAAEGSERVRLDENLRQLRQAIEDARAYIASNPDTTGSTGAGAGVRHVSFENFRG